MEREVDAVLAEAGVYFGLRVGVLYILRVGCIYILYNEYIYTHYILYVVHYTKGVTRADLGYSVHAFVGLPVIRRTCGRDKASSCVCVCV